MPAEARATKTTAARKAPAARQRAGQPAARSTRQPATARITNLGDPGEMTAQQIQLAQLQQQVADLQQQTALAQQAAVQRQELPPAPGRPGDPDILGLPGLKPLRITTDEDDDEPVTRHALFYIGDKAFTVPDWIGMDVVQEYLHRAAVSGALGEVAAQDYMLTALLGEDAYAELRAYKKLKASEFAWIITTCTRIMLGALESPKA